jgi:cell division protein FtsQ
MKKILKIIFLVILCWYTYISYIEFKKKPLFDITKVTIKTKDEKLLKNLIDSLSEYRGKNILEIDENKLSNEIKKDIRINKVIIKKQIPDILSIELEVKKPAVYVEYEGKVYIADKSGIIYGYMNETKRYNMPLFRIDKERDIKEFIEIMEEINFRDEISQIYRIKNGLVVIMNSGLKIITDSNVEPKRYKVIKKLIHKEEGIEYIDLRFKDYIIKK